MADPQARIFISYRREDSAGHVLALLPALRRQFGDRVFKDTDNIPPGDNFVRSIKRELDSCSVLLAVIGRDWLTVQDPRLKTRRLDNPDDFLRVEVSTALKSERIRVIPVLVERSTMPSAADLPADLADLAHRNALELSDARWESDVQLLIQAIQRACAVAVEPAEAPPQRPELQNLEKRRAREITAHLAAAQEAFDARDYEAALLSCEKVLLLDPRADEALDLLDRARKAIDEQKIETWLKEARQSLRRGDTGGASDLIDQALSIDPASEDALSLRKEMLAVRRERERDRERARAVVAAVRRAQTSLDEEDFDGAVRHAEDALALDPQSADAQDVRSKAVAALEERRRQREARRRAQQPVTVAREERSAEAARVADEQRRAEARARQQADAERERERAREAREPEAVPEFSPIRRYRVLGAAAAVILSSAIGLWQYQQSPDPQSDGGSGLSAPTSTPQTTLTSSVPGRSGTPNPSAPAGRSARGTSAGPVATSTIPPLEEGKRKENAAAPPSRPKPPDPAPSGPSPVSSEPQVLGPEEKRVADVVQRYVTASNDRNVAAVKEVYPTAPNVERLAEYESFNLQLRNVKIVVYPDGAFASVFAAQTRSMKPRRSAAATQRVQSEFTLQKQGGSWIIVSVTDKK